MRPANLAQLERKERFLIQFLVTPGFPQQYAELSSFTEEISCASVSFLRVSPHTSLLIVILSVCVRVLCCLRCRRRRGCHPVSRLLGLARFARLASLRSVFRWLTLS